MQSASSQIIEQIKVVEEVVLSEVSNLSDSVMNKNQGHQTQRFQKKWICYCHLFLLSAIALIDG